MKITTGQIWEGTLTKCRQEDHEASAFEHLVHLEPVPAVTEEKRESAVLGEPLEGGAHCVMGRWDVNKSYERSAGSA